MSKMSQLAMELDEQAAELGFRDYIEAELHGWRVNYETHKLEPPVVQPSLNEMEELKKAHEAWEKEKEKVLANLSLLRDQLSNEVSHYNIMGKDDWEIIEDAINFVEKGEA